MGFKLWVTGWAEGLTMSRRSIKFLKRGKNWAHVTDVDPNGLVTYTDMNLKGAYIDKSLVAKCVKVILDQFNPLKIIIGMDGENSGYWSMDAIQHGCYWMLERWVREQKALHSFKSNYTDYVYKINPGPFDTEDLPTQLALLLDRSCGLVRQVSKERRGSEDEKFRLYYEMAMFREDVAEILIEGDWTT